MEVYKSIVGKNSDIVYSYILFLVVQIPSPRVYDEAVRLQSVSSGLEGSGSSECQGRLELYIARDGLWGTACDRNFGSEEAAVVIDS